MLTDRDAAICVFYAFLEEFRTGEPLFGINRVDIGRFGSNSDYGVR
jgi:hypothetical protein